MPSHATAVVVAPTEALLAWTRYGQGASASFPDACVRMCCQLRSSAEWEERNVDAFNAKELGHFYLAANEEWTHDDVATRKVKRNFLHLLPKFLRQQMAESHEAYAACEQFDRYCCTYLFMIVCRDHALTIVPLTSSVVPGQSPPCCKPVVS